MEPKPRAHYTTCPFYPYEYDCIYCFRGGKETPAGLNHDAHKILKMKF